MLATLPDDPFALTPTPPFRPAGRRALRVWGAPVDVTWLPERAGRQGAPTAERPVLAPSPAARILATEAVWTAGGCAITPNPYPIAERELLLWSTDPVRELPLPLIELALTLEERVDGALTINSVGAAASITRAHVHLMGERTEFLPALPRRTVRPDYLADCAGVESLQLDVPVLTLGLRGPVPARAVALHRVLELRRCAAYNVASQGGETWLLPRSAVEITAPHFPQALGAAEFWGRWCFADRAAFERADGASLERALALGGVPAEGA